MSGILLAADRRKTTLEEKVMIIKDKVAAGQVPTYPVQFSDLTMQAADCTIAS
jgi:hypothetical protein